MLTKGAIGNLINRYRAVLKKCNLINTFGSLAVAAMLVMGGAGVAVADYANYNGYKQIDVTGTSDAELIASGKFSNKITTLELTNSDDLELNDFLDAATAFAQINQNAIIIGDEFKNKDSYSYNIPKNLNRLVIGGRYSGVWNTGNINSNGVTVESASIKMTPNTVLCGELNAGGLSIGEVVFSESEGTLTLMGNNYSSHVKNANIEIKGGELYSKPENLVEAGHTRIRAGGVSHNNAIVSVEKSTITISGNAGKADNPSKPHLPYTIIMGGGANGGYYAGKYNKNGTMYAETKVGYYYDNGQKVWYNTTKESEINIEKMAYRKNILEAGEYNEKETSWLGSTIFAGGDNAYVGTSTINLTDSSVGAVFAGGESYAVTNETFINLKNSAIYEFYSGGMLTYIGDRDPATPHETMHDNLVGNVHVNMKDNSALHTWADQIFYVTNNANENDPPIYTIAPDKLKTWTYNDAEAGISFTADNSKNRIYLRTEGLTEENIKDAQDAIDTHLNNTGTIEVIRTCKADRALGNNATNTETGKLSAGWAEVAGSTLTLGNGTDETVIHLTGHAEVKDYYLNPLEAKDIDKDEAVTHLYNVDYATTELLTQQNPVTTVSDDESSTPPVSIETLKVVDNATLRLGNETEHTGGKISGNVMIDGGTLEVVGGNFTLANVQAKANSVITVGNSNSAATLILGHDSSLNNALILLDPAWKGSPDLDIIQNASQVYKETNAIGDDRRRIDGRYAVVQNSVLTLGQMLPASSSKDDIAKATELKNWAIDQFTTNIATKDLGIRWGEDDTTSDNKEVTAALVLLKRFGLKYDEASNSFIGALYVDGSKTDADLSTLCASVEPGTVTFADKSLLMMPVDVVENDKIALNTVKKLNVAGTSKVYIAGAEEGGEYTIVKVRSTNKNDVNIEAGGWDGDNILLALDLEGELVKTTDENDGRQLVIIKVSKADLNKVLPGLLVPEAVARRGNDTSNAGSAFLATAMEWRDKAAATALVNEVARASVTAGVQNTALRISDTASSVVLDHMSLSQHDGSRSIHADGVDFWAAPMYGNLYTSGMTVSGDSVRGQFGGLALGADMEASNILGGKLRLGAAINGGGGKSEAKGTVTSVQNDYGFGGISLYAGWNRGAFNVIGSVGYSMGDHEVEMHMPASMDMGKAKADVDTSAVTADLRTEYQLKTAYVDILPHIGVRYTALRTDSHDLKMNGSALNSFESDTQHIVQFPVGVTLSRDFAFADWNVKPSFDVSVIPAAGDKKNSTTVRFSGVDAVDSFESRVMDSTSWAGAIGVQVEKGNMSFGLNYGVQASSHETDQNVQLKLGWKF